MKSIRRPLISLALLFVSLSLLPGSVMGQCVVINTMSYTTSAPATVFITKTLSSAAMCRVTVSGDGAAQCFPGTMYFNTAMLYAVRTGGSPDPFCNWECDCGTGAPPHVTTGTSDGLPVELMEFQIDVTDFASPGKD